MTPVVSIGRDPTRRYTPPMAGSPFAAFAAVATSVAATTSRLAKRDLLAAYLRDLPAADVPRAATFFAGRPLAGMGDRLGLGWVQLSSALQAASGAGDDALRAAYLRHSDPGDAAADLLEGRAGAAPWPLTLADVEDAFRAMAAAGSAAARMLATISKGAVEIDPVRAEIDPERCSGCRICNTLCPYSAIGYREEKNVSEVNAAVCKGCGTCVAACPAGAITGYGFSDQQIYAEMEGLLAV